MSTQVNPSYGGVKWSPNDRVLDQLRELRRDFMQPLPEGRELFALRITGVSCDTVSRDQLEISGFGQSLSHPHIFRGDEHEPVIYGLFFDRDDPLRMNSDYLDQWFVVPAINVLQLLCESDHPEVNRDRKSWNCGREWLRLLFDSWSCGPGYSVDDTGHAFRSAADKVTIAPNWGFDTFFSEMMPLPMSPPEPEKDYWPHPFPEQDFKAFDYDRIELMETDLRTASARLIDWMIRELVVTGADEKAKRGKPGTEKWRKTQKRMLAMLQQGELPNKLRRAVKLLESEDSSYNYSSVHAAAHKSPTLMAHFGLANEDGKEQGVSGNLLDELALQSDHRTRQAIERMTPDQRREAEAAMRDMDTQRALELVRALAKDPDAKSAMPGMPSLDADEQDPTDPNYIRKKARKRDVRAGKDYEDDDWAD